MKALKGSIEHSTFANEGELIHSIVQNLVLDQTQIDKIESRAAEFIEKIQASKAFSIEQFLRTYDLSTDEGVAILCLAESLSRIADKNTAFELVVDKLSDKDWASHFARAHTALLKLTSIGLTISGKWSDICDSNEFWGKLLTKISKEAFLGIIKQVILWLGSNFIIGHNIKEGVKNTKDLVNQGYSFSFDLLGESARTFNQSSKYYNQYIDAVNVVGHGVENKSISVKLTALYPRFEAMKLRDIKQYLLPNLISLIKSASENGITITFDAEESYRLSSYLTVIEELLAHKELAKARIGVVVQAYLKCSSSVIDYLITLAKKNNKKIPIRLVKGAYWDAEIKHAQMYGLEDYPVFTKKEFTDINYINCAKKILDNSEYFAPQFATHNAITAATIIELSGDKDFEFQKLHGMGDVLHSSLIKGHHIRVYAPVGEISDLLAYLMRRLLENGANTSFVHQVSELDARRISADIKDIFEKGRSARSIVKPLEIYENRVNSQGYDMGYQMTYEEICSGVEQFKGKMYKVGPIIDGKHLIAKHTTEHFLPAKYAEKIGEVSVATESDMLKAVASAKDAFDSWSELEVSKRADILRKIADLYQENRYELYSLLIAEAGKSINDAVNEVREAIDFCRYYATLAENTIKENILQGVTGEKNILTMHGRGVFLCISPWNFPLAIFTGQVVAALVAGNSVIAKPADPTPIIANFATQLMHKAMVPTNVLHLVIASGSQVGKYIVPNQDIAGVAFTGSNATAKLINTTLASRDGGIIPIIAETGGQNAMIVDSSALLEQVTDDVLASAFYSAGQRCSALRILYVQDEIYDSLLEMISSAINTIKIGDTRDLSMDVGPVIDKGSYDSLVAHVKDMEVRGFNIKAVHAQENSPQQDGYFFYPRVIEISSINDVEDEKFGPILHVIRYKIENLDAIIDEINSCGYGLTFGIHSRIERRIEHVKSRVKVGNIYVNRSTVGAQVESQPFGGENKSGTGFKAGGPHYLLRFMVERTTSINLTAIGGNVELLNGTK